MRSAQFPQPVATFVGRRDELARIAELLDASVVTLIYGVAGIGKTELGYQVIAEARRAGRFAGAAAVLWRVTPGSGLDAAAAALVPRRRAGRHGRDLAAIAAALDARETLVLIDDAHHAEPQALAALLHHLARHVTRSRVLVTSRVELAVAPDPPPAVVRVEALREPEVAELGRRVAALRGASAPDGSQLYRRSAGSPFRVLRALAGPGADGDVLAAELAGLAAPARRALLVAALGDGRLAADELGAPPETIAELTRRFLVDDERGVALVHDLVREALDASAAQRAVAHREVAAALLRRGAPRAALDVVAAIEALVAAGDHAEAWRAYQRCLRDLVGGGVAHLLLAALAAMHAALPDERLAIDLARARTLLARSRVADAHALLERAVHTPAGRRSARCLGLLGTALERAGRLRRAEEVFRDALAVAEDGRARFEIMVELANLRSLRGDGGSARALLAEARRQRPAATGHERRRHRHAVIVSWVYDERYAEATRATDGAGASSNRSFELRALELLARAESDDLAGARRLLEDLRAGGDDDPALVPYEGLIGVLAGDVLGARAALERGHRELEADSDRALALLAGHYVGHALLALGEPDEATAVLDRLTARAAEAEMDSTEAHNRAVAAIAALEAGRLDEASARALRLDAPGIPVRARFLGGVVRGRLLALGGDVAGGRAAIEVAVAAVPGADRAMVEGLATLELAELELLGGDPARAHALASDAAHRYATAGRRWLEGRALVARGLALASTGEPGDRTLAARDLAAAWAIAEPRGHAGLLARIAVGAAAVRIAGGARGDAVAHLDEALAAARGPMTGLDVQLLRAARASACPAGVPVGLERLVTALGLRGGRHDLIIDLSRHLIAAPTTGRSVRGHPVAAALLADLVAHDPDGVDAETLYLRVWGGREYHALRHRNTVYVGICRLRRTLERILPGRTVIETTPAGWRLADGVRAALGEVSAP